MIEQIARWEFELLSILTHKPQTLEEVAELLEWSTETLKGRLDDLVGASNKINVDQNDGLTLMNLNGVVSSIAPEVWGRAKDVRVKAGGRHILVARYNPLYSEDAALKSPLLNGCELIYYDVKDLLGVERFTEVLTIGGLTQVQAKAANPVDWAQARLDEILENYLKYGVTRVFWEPTGDDDSYREVYSRTFDEIDYTIKVEQHIGGNYQSYLYHENNLVWVAPGLHEVFERSRGMAVIEMHRRIKILKPGQRFEAHPELFTPHPKNHDIYGDENQIYDLLGDLNVPPEDRQIDDVFAVVEGYIFSGCRRFATAFALNHVPGAVLFPDAPDTPIYPIDSFTVVIEQFESEEELELRLIKHNNSRQKKISTLIKEGRVREKVYRKQARENMKLGAQITNSKLHGNIAVESPLLNLGGSQKKLRVTAKVAEEIGIGRSKYENGCKVLDAIEVVKESNPQLAADWETYMNEGNVNGAYKIISLTSDDDKQRVLDRVLSKKAPSVDAALQQLGLYVTPPTPPTSRQPQVTTSDDDDEDLTALTAVAAVTPPPEQQPRVTPTVKPPTQQTPTATLTPTAPTSSTVTEDEAEEVSEEEEQTGVLVPTETRADKDKPTDNYLTDDEAVAKARKFLGVIDLDPFASATPKTEIGVRNITYEENSLTQEWCNEDGSPVVIFTNIPYSKSNLCFAKFAEQIEKGYIKEAVVITKENSIHNQGNERLRGAGAVIEQFASAWLHHRGRRDFPPGDRVGRVAEELGNPKFDVIFVYFGERWAEFAVEHEEWGTIGINWRIVKDLITKSTPNTKRNKKP